MFNIGAVHITQGINYSLEAGEISPQQIQTILIKHMNNIDDNIYPEDRALNQEAINNNCGRVLTVHKISDFKIYCITEGLGNPEYLNTIILHADEY